MKKLVSISALLASLALLAGCPSKPKEVPPPPPTPTTDTSGVGDPNGMVGDTDTTAGPPGELLSKRIIYFDFDRSDLREDARTVLAENARRLQGKATARVSIEGHCDERGTVEYNLALGEKRAAAAKDYLVNYGITADRVSTVSFGEERPLDPAGTEDAYAKNRRDEFVVQ